MKTQLWTKFNVLTVILLIGMCSLTLPSFAQYQEEQTRNYDLPVYKLFPTQNIWTFLKLNTRNGKVWVLQYDTKDSNRFQYTLSHPRVGKQDEENGRFILHPTENVWNFILLDQVDGRVWQMQWDMDMENQFIVRIPEIE